MLGSSKDISELGVERPGASPLSLSGMANRQGVEGPPATGPSFEPVFIRLRFSVE